ncbi:TolC family outer membrane protein [Marinobacterium sp. AK62]|uniref:TolC family outer membrane protein n=1 Tax=Marinobacterium alkalitolerans TaxID=1542925 RepID=A0ABS3ZCH2_9GAMM|nr:TolC family outer membrane protein [Marinobacterium alkalitolerans]MBP0049402.1 TolC family outer membrane protein [Marinobacterium alkalitolerans]
MKLLKQHCIPVLIAGALATGQVQAAALADLYRQALANDPQLKAAEARYLAGQEALPQGKAGLLPQVSATGSITQADSGLLDQEADDRAWQVSLVQPVFDSAAWYGYQKSKMVSQQAQLNYDFAQQQLVLRTVNAYLGVLNASSALDTARAQERALKRRLDQVNAQFDVGLIAITDVQEAQASFDNAVVQRIDAEGALANSYEALERLSGQPVSAIDALKEDYPISPISPRDPTAWLEKAREGNLALKLSELGVDISRRDAQIARAGRHPKVQLQANYGYSESEFQAQDWDDNSAVALTFSMPLYTGGANSSRVRQAEQGVNAARFDHEDQYRTVTEETRSLLRDLQTSVESVKARQQSIKSRETALRATEEGFNVGTRNVVDVLQAEQALYQARLDYATARFNHVSTLFSFKLQLGTLSPDDLYALDEWLDAS